jgi:hypothetical protein
LGCRNGPPRTSISSPPEASIPTAGEALEIASRGNGWSVERVHDAETFRRLIQTDEESGTMVDLAQDAGPLAEPTITTVGPTYPAPELAARKVLALFDRAALRDAIDVDRVSGAYPKELLIDIAGSIDEGFDLGVLAQMLSGLDRFTDEQITAFGVEATALRERFHRWAAEIAGHP